MTQQSSAMYALSFRSADAEKVEEGYRFTIRSELGKFKATRVTLASFELPFSQYNMEREWNRLGFTERQRIEEGARRIVVEETSIPLKGEPALTTGTAVLPLHLNRIEEFVWNGETRTVRVTTEREHGLWANGRSVVPLFSTWSTVELVATPGGDYDLSLAEEQGRLSQVDARSFTLHLPPLQPAPPPASSSSAAGYLLCPSPPSPSFLCDAITFALRESPLERRYRVRYDAKENRALLGALAYPDGSDRLKVCVQGDLLVKRIGHSCGACRIFKRRALDPSTLGPCVDPLDTSMRTLLQTTQNIASEGGDVPPLNLPSEQYALTNIEFREGWYSPTRRSFATTQPLAREFELQFNRFFLPPREDGGPAIVFVDPFGRLNVAPLLPGRYDALSLASTMQKAMNESEGSEFSVTYDGSAFRFQCLRGAGGGASASSTLFSIRFSHPKSIEASRLGFESIPYEGSSLYVSSNPVLVPQTQWPPSATMRMPSNMYQMSEDQTRSRLQIAPLSPPSLSGVVAGHADAALEVDTFLNGSRFAHGFKAGDVVQISAPASNVEIALTAQGGKESVPPADAGFVRGVVLTSASPSVLRLHVAPAAWGAAVGKAVLLSTAIEPCSFDFGERERSLGGRLGFEKRVYQWGKDGTQVAATGLRLPPFLPSGTTSIDLPEYVLIYLLEGQKSSLLQHHTKGEVTLPFAKIVFGTYSYKEERALTRDLVLSSGESLSRFTIAIKNPDGTDWKLHSQEFSFTLNMVL